MKIYFAGSIRGGRDDKGLYSSIIKILSKYGKVLTEHVGNKKLTSLGEVGPTNRYIYERDIKWLKEADHVIAEVTTPSLGVGYEIAKAEEWNKKILCLHREVEGKRISAMISGNKNLTVMTYKNLNGLTKLLHKFLSSPQTK